MPMINQDNSGKILANADYPILYAFGRKGNLTVTTEKPEEGSFFQLPNLTAEDFGDAGFRKTYGLKYALYGGAMANGIASSDMAIALGKAGCMGSYGSGGQRLEVVAQEIDKMKAALGEKPFLVNMLSNRNADMEMQLAQLLIDKKVLGVEASAYIVPSEALVYFRLKGIHEENGKIVIPHKIIAKVSREEVLEKFVSPPAAESVASLLKAGRITEEEAALAAKIPMADDITAEADSGGHTDGRPMVSMLPALIALANRKQAEFGYQQKVRVGAGGGVGTGLSCLGAFEMGAAYVVTGSVNQGCVESGTSDYVKQILAETAMADVTMAPCADMFEMGAKVEVIKKKTMYAQNAQKLYEYYVKYPSFDAIPAADRDRIEKKILKDSFDSIWAGTKEYFSRVDPSKIPQAEKNPKMKMALVFRWYLGSSSRWAVQGDPNRKFDMQIWCGQSMGAFNLWVKGTPLEKAENRHVGEVAKLLLNSCAYHYMRNLLIRMGAAPENFGEDIL